jgi:N-acetylmuramoyl-L-alanine amidase
VVSDATFLAALDAQDLRATLPRNTWTMPERVGPARSITLHYNGPALPMARRFGAGAIRQLALDAQYQMADPGRVFGAQGADGLQYHIAIDIDGVISLCRPLALTLWHAGHAEPNNHGLSVHLLLGESQSPSSAQWDATIRVCAWFCRELGLRRDVVRGHKEWGGRWPTACPGAPIMQRLDDWRDAEADDLTIDRYVVTVAVALVREGPGRTFPVALDGAARLAQGMVIECDAVVTGQWIAGTDRWVHLADGRGFVHTGAVRPLAHTGTTERLA